jgi:hypothetical protein
VKVAAKSQEKDERHIIATPRNGSDLMRRNINKFPVNKG